MSKILTMTEVANELGLSRNAVSAVMNNRARKFGLSAATENRVREYIDKSGYVQARHALQTKTGDRNDTVDLLYCGEFPRYSHVHEALACLSNAIEEKYGMVEITGIAPARVKGGIKEQVAKRTDRLIWILNKSMQIEIQNSKFLLPLLERIEHVVFYNCFMENSDQYTDCGIHLVGFDRGPAFRQTADMLWNKGHRKIALNEVFFANRSQAMPYTEMLRKVFYDKGFEVFGLMPDNHMDIPEPQHSRIMAENLLALNVRHQVTCSFIRNDNQAIEIFCLLLKHGVKVPEDIAIIGYGGSPLARVLPVPLTTFHPPVARMCTKVLELIDAEAGIPGQKWLYEDELIEGETH